MQIVEIVFFIVGVLLLVVGYRKNSRNILLTGAIILFLSGAVGSAVEGFISGYQQADKI